ncbi:hypothetical protein [Rosenbergiella epipactidis]|uniref:hypothetical protein n=1 Tax=Rosenbergiella epipactidis TaxID=1544694 RepID=UPI001F4EB155|nr:hypothetical protein [Rosenbergiella epipactidis]
MASLSLEGINIKEIDLSIPLRIIGRAIRLMVENDLTMGKEDIVAQIHTMSLTATDAEELIYYRLAIQTVTQKSH